MQKNRKLAEELQCKDEFIHFLRVQVGINLLVRYPYISAQSTIYITHIRSLKSFGKQSNAPSVRRWSLPPTGTFSSRICVFSSYPPTASTRACDHIFCCECLVELFEVNEKEHDIIGLHQCPAQACMGIIASSPVRDPPTEALVSLLQMADGKPTIDTPPTPPNFFDKYFILDAYLESCAKPPIPSQSILQ